VQRLFSTFPEGWPGTGLIFLRAVAAIPPIQNIIAGRLAAPLPALAIPQAVAAGAAMLLLVGLWTPVAGVLMAIAELCLAFSHPTDPWMHIMLGT
jgi:putative oxidoreductase